MPPPPKVYIIVLNFRAWQDTVECLRGLEALTYRPFEAVVLDNASGDGSLDHIRAAVEGNLSYPAHFIQRPDNGGFAAGNNAGLRFARARGDGRYFWVLNNDTVVQSGALAALVDAAQADRAAGRKVGLYGSKLLYHSRPNTLQAVGATYNKWLAVTREIGGGQEDRGQYDDPAPRPDVLIGASLFASEEFLADVGLLGEDYFLYYEEHDWAVRAARRGWGLRVVPQSAVRHKQGLATGAADGDVSRKSRLSDFYAFRNRLLFTARHHPLCLPTVYLSFLPSAWLRLRRGQGDRLPMMLKLMLTFFRKPLLRP